MNLSKAFQRLFLKLGNLFFELYLGCMRKATTLELESLPPEVFVEEDDPRIILAHPLFSAPDGRKYYNPYSAPYMMYFSDYVVRVGKPKRWKDEMVTDNAFMDKFARGLGQ